MSEPASAGRQLSLTKQIDRGLAATARHGAGLISQRLGDEGGNHPAVVRLHARTVGVEDPSDSDRVPCSRAYAKAIASANRFPSS